MEIWLATGNKGKKTEFESMLSDTNFEIHSQSELSFFSQPPENGDTFLANARIKAKSLHAIKNTSWVIADDSGLVVDELNGLPGIHSARYAGDKAQPSENNAKLLKMVKIRCGANPKAHFHCSIVAIDPQGTEHVFEGKLDGTIPKMASGQSGFGYDPVFVPEGSEKTLAEHTPGEKNAISHRAKALQQLVDILKKSV